MKLKAWICIDSPDGEPVSEETCGKIIDQMVNNPRPEILKSYEKVTYENCYFLYDTKSRVLTMVHSRIKDNAPMLSATFRRDVSDSVVKSEESLLSFLEYSYNEGYEGVWYQIVKPNVTVNIPESEILDRYDLSSIFDLDIQILKLMKNTKINVHYTLEHTEPKISQYITKCFRVYLNTVETNEFDDIFLEKARFYNIPLPDEIKIRTGSQDGVRGISIEYVQDQIGYLTLMLPTYNVESIRDSLIDFYEKTVPNRSFFTVTGKIYQEIIPYLSRFGYRETHVRVDGEEDVVYDNVEFSQSEPSNEVFSFSIPLVSYVIKTFQEVTPNE